MKEYELGHVTQKKEFILYFIILVATIVAMSSLLEELNQIIASTVFIALVVGTLMFWRFRVGIAFIGIVILLVTKTIDLTHAVEFMSLDVILFLMGMMVIVGVLRRSGFFRLFLGIGLKYSNFNPYLLFPFILVLSAVMAAMVDEVTSILFITALVLDFCSYFKINPVRLTISVIFATNIGSSWSVLGNPIGILIALRSGLTFEDFMMTALPVGLIAFIILMPCIYFWMRKDILIFQKRLVNYTEKRRQKFLNDLLKIDNPKLVLGCTIIFFGTILLLMLHHRMEAALGLQHNTLLVGSSLFGAGIAMLWQRDIARDLIRKDVDWWTLVFFMFLFAKAGALKYVGLTDLVGQALIQFTGEGQLIFLLMFILWFSAITSAAADNVVVIATLIPVIQYVTTQMNSDLLWWALLFGGCYGGNLTMVGSTANIVALGMLEEKEHQHMTLTYWMKFGIIGFAIPMFVGTIALLILNP